MMIGRGASPVTSHLRLVAKIAMGYRGYGLPISEVVSEGNVGLMQAVKRFEPRRDFVSPPTPCVDQGVDSRVHPAFVVAREMGTTRTKEETVLTCARRRARSRRSTRAICIPTNAADRKTPRRHGAGRGRHEPPSRRRRSLNAPIRDDGEAGRMQDWLVDNRPTGSLMAEHEEFDHRRQALNGADRRANPRNAESFEARRLAEDPMTLEDLANEFGVCASACGRSRCAPSRSAIRVKHTIVEGGSRHDGSRALIDAV